MVGKKKRKDPANQGRKKKKEKEEKRKKENKNELRNEIWKRSKMHITLVHRVSYLLVSSPKFSPGQFQLRPCFAVTKPRPGILTCPCLCLCSPCALFTLLFLCLYCRAIHSIHIRGVVTAHSTLSHTKPPNTSSLSSSPRCHPCPLPGLPHSPTYRTKKKDVSRLKMLPPDDASSSSSAPSSSSSPPSPSSFAFPSSSSASPVSISSPFEAPSSTSTNSDSTFISTSISTSSPRPLARVHLISPDTHSSSSSSPSHHPSPDHIPSPLTGQPTSSGRTTFYLPHFLTGLRPYSQSRVNNINDSSNKTTTITPPSILQPSPLSNTLSENEQEQEEEEEDPRIIVTEVKSINFRDITIIPTTSSHRRSKRRKSSSSHSSSPSLHPSSFDPSSSSSSSTSGSARRKRAKKSTSVKVPWNLCTPSCDCSRSKGSSSANLEPLPKASPGSHDLLSTQPMESTGRIRTHSETDVQVSESISSSHLVNSSSGSSDNSKSRHRHHQHHRRHRHSHSSPSKELQPEERRSSTTSFSDSRAFNITQESSNTERGKYHEEKCIHHRRDDHYPHHKRQRSPPSMPFESSIPSTSSIKLDRTKRARHLTSSSHDDTSVMDDVENMDVQELAWQDLNEDSNRGHRSRSSIHEVRNASRLPPSSEHPQELSPNSHHHHTTSNEIDVPSTIHFSKGAAAISTKGTSEGAEPSIHPFDTAQPTESTLPSIRPSTPGVDSLMPSRSPHPSKEASQVTSKAPDQARSSHGEAPSRKTKSVRILSSVPLSRSGPSQSVALPPPLTLPITRDTLRELDLFEIFKNPQLRHDIVFDPHLQFRPNFDGERGLIKKREADRFWREVDLELNTRQTAIAMRREAAATMLSLAGLSSSSSRLIQQEQQQKCPLPTPNLLPKLIDELREILLSLLPVPPPQDGKGPQPPNPERVLLASTLDPELLLQELDHGVLDVHGLFRYLGDSLKGHCAPMRDAFVESMVSAVVQSGEIVRGIRMCFEILELMKLVSDDQRSCTNVLHHTRLRLLKVCLCVLWMGNRISQITSFAHFGHGSWTTRSTLSKSTLQSNLLEEGHSRGHRIGSSGRGFDGRV